MATTDDIADAVWRNSGAQWFLRSMRPGLWDRIAWGIMVGTIVLCIAAAITHGVQYLRGYALESCPTCQSPHWVEAKP